MGRICPSCGYDKIREDASFCSRCGVQLPPPPPKKTEEEKVKPQEPVLPPVKDLPKAKPEVSRETNSKRHSVDNAAPRANSDDYFSGLNIKETNIRFKDEDVPHKKKPKRGNRMVWIYVIIALIIVGIGTVALIYFLSNVMGSDKETEKKPREEKEFAELFREYVNSGNREGIQMLYPSVSPADSILSTLNGGLKIEKHEYETITVNYGPDVTFYLSSDADGLKYVDSYGFLLWPDEMVEYAVSCGRWNESASDMEKKNLMGNSDFYDSYRLATCPLTSERIKKVIKGNNATLEYNILGHMVRDIKAMNVALSGYGYDEEKVTPTGDYTILSSDDSSVEVDVEYTYGESGYIRHYTVVLRPEKVESANGNVSYVWLIDDVKNHPEDDRNRNVRERMVRSFYNGLKQYVSPESYWFYNYNRYYYSLEGDSSDLQRAKKKFIELAEKFILSYEDFYKDRVPYYY